MKQRKIADYAALIRPTGFENNLRADMARLQATLQDRRNWGRALRSYKGGFGTGRIDDEPEHDGHLFGVIPIESERLRAIWEALDIQKGPKSAWHQIEEFDEFQLAIDAIKLSRNMFWTYWPCRISFYFQRGSNVVEVANIKWFGANTIADLFLLLDRLIKQFEAPPELPLFARKQLS